jgi:hypothetical protein
MWPDNETVEDLIGYEIHQRLIHSLVTKPDMLPVTVGLFGDWGCGKSSVLRLLEQSFAPVGKTDPEHLVIYFDTWLFEGYEDAKTAILAVLIKELRDNKTFGSKIRDEATSLLRRLNWMKVAKVAFAAGVSYFAGNPLPLGVALGAAEEKEEESGKGSKNDEKKEKAGDNWLRPVEDTTSDVKSFRKDFAELISKTGLKSLIVIVDDLDRCSPERVIENLEAIKLFLNVPKVAFVIAADRRIVENAISVRYSKYLSNSVAEADRKLLVNDYLEKLVQVPYILPKLAPHEVRSYWNLLLCKKYAPHQFEGVHRAYKGFISNNRYETFDVQQRLSFAADDEDGKAINEHFRIIEVCSEAITEGLKGNPRQIKRFLNALWMRLELARLARLETLNHAILVKLMVLEYIDDDRFRDTYESHRKSEDGTADLLKKLEGVKSDTNVPPDLKSWDMPQLLRWVRAEPKLSGEDLRDYFWISRSSINDAFAGVQMLSPTVRSCIDQLLIGDIGGQRAGIQLFNQLGPTEQKQVVTALGREALSHPTEPEAWESLFKLASGGSLLAAEYMARSLEQAKGDDINLRMAHALASLVDNGQDSAKALIKTRDNLITRGGKFWTAVKGARS